MTHHLSIAEIERLREAYNATLSDVVVVHDQLRIFRVRPDAGSTIFAPGQYTVLGLGNWEPRVDGDIAEEQEHSEHPAAEFDSRITRRAYSFSCTPLDERGELFDPAAANAFEFYVALVPNSAKHIPLLTPRLFAMRPGDRLYVGPKATGHYSLERVEDRDNLLFIATGTGEAPHNTMIAHLLRQKHRGRLASVVTARRYRDLAYAGVHRRLEERYPQYRYLTLTTREPENLDPNCAGYVGKRYVQNMLDSGELERAAGFSLNPETAHVFLCGNPAMIGAPQQTRRGETIYTHEGGMVELLSRRGFTIDLPHEPGRLHFEKYWN